MLTYALFAILAVMKSAKSGCALFGFDLNSWVELYRDEPRVILHFNNLDQIQLRINPSDTQAIRLEIFTINIIELETVTVTLRNHFFAISFKESEPSANSQG